MKRIFTLLGIVGAGLCLTPKASAQSMSVYFVSDSCQAHLAQTNLSLGITVTTASTGCSIETNFGDGSKLDTNAVTGSGTSKVSFANHTYTTTGSYTIKHVLICGGLRVDSLSRSQAINCTMIGGNMYRDLNTNCIYNTGEPLVNYAMDIEVDSAGTIVDTVHAYGYWAYHAQALTTTVYKFKLLNAPTGYVVSCPSSGVITYTYFPGSGFAAPQNFGFNCSSTPTYDYSLLFSRALRGSTSTGASFIRLFAAQASCQTGTGTVTLNVSPKYTITSSGITPTPTSVSGNTVTWTLNNMSSNNYTQLYVPLVPKSTTNNGDTACNYAIITPTSGDVNLANNTINVCDSVRASWDPNDKSVAPGGPVSAGTVLTYTINFENLGNDTAFNVHIMDTLSQYLNANTFDLIAATHPVNPTIYEMGGKSIIKFDFPNINLADKSQPLKNKGQVMFDIRIRNNAPVGTVINNRAGIYFDGNPVVLTNYASNHIPKPESVPGVYGSSSIKVHPNPAGKVLHIQVLAKGWDEAVLSNTMGQVVQRQTLSNGTNSLNIASLPAGVYYLQVSGTAGSVAEKIEKQ